MVIYLSKHRLWFILFIINFFKENVIYFLSLDKENNNGNKNIYANVYTISNSCKISFL